AIRVEVKALNAVPCGQNFGVRRMNVRGILFNFTQTVTEFGTEIKANSGAHNFVHLQSTARRRERYTAFDVFPNDVIGTACVESTHIHFTKGLRTADANTEIFGENVERSAVLEINRTEEQAAASISILHYRFDRTRRQPGVTRIGSLVP